MTQPKTTTVDASDRLDEIDDRMAEVESEAEAQGVETDSEDYVDLAREYEELEHARDLLESRFDEWGGSEFTIKKFGYADEGHVDDLVRADTIRAGEDDPRTKLSAFKLRTIQVGVVRTPSECPDDPSDPSFPPTLGEWLYERIDNFNRFGETSLEDFTLSRRLESDTETTD